MAPRIPLAGLAAALVVSPLAHAGALAGAQGVVPVPEAQLAAVEGQPFDELGRSVAIDGDTALAGAPSDDGDAPGGAQDSGSAYVFVRGASGWVQQAKLVPDDLALDDELGSRVALSGDTAAFGLELADDAGASSGAAYVFVRSGTTWSQQAKIVPADGAAGDTFGRSIALDGDTLAIGAPNDDDQGPTSGAVYVFVRSGTTWSQQAKIVPAEAAQLDFVGTAVALEGDTLLATAILDDDAVQNGGACYVYVRSGTSWARQAKLFAADAAPATFFGASVALAGDRAVVGAPEADTGADEAGAAYVFLRTGTSWAQEGKLTAPDGATNDHLGQAVAVSGDAAFAGAAEHDGPDVNRGALYAFHRDPVAGWSLRAKLSPTNGNTGDRFGTSVDTDGARLIVGTSPDVHAGEDPGSAEIFALEPAVSSFCDAGPCPCGNAGAPGHGCENARATGGVRLDAADYAPDPLGSSGGSTATLVGTGFPPANAPTVVIVRSSGLAAAAPLGDGLLCLDASLVRLRATTAAAGTASRTLAHGAGPGTFHYQMWYRSEPAAFCTPAAFNLSNGVSIVWP